MTQVDALARIGAQLARVAPSLTFPGEGDFASRLTLGQIIKGRVLRSYEGQRYLVEFGGEQHVVDSALPLRPDEVFQGRVVGLGEQVQLQKLASEVPDPRSATPALTTATARDDDSLAALFARYRAEAAPTQIDAASTTVNRLPQPALASLGALVLAKLGLPLDATLIRALHARLVGQEPQDPARAALRLDTAAPAATQLQSAVMPLASALAAAVTGALIEQPQASATGSGGGDSRRAPREPGTRILNVQTGGAVAHRLGTLPLVVDGRLLELEIALFDEGEPGRGAPEGAPAVPRHRQIVIALDTEALGHVEVRARLAGTRMDVSLATASSEHTLALSLHGARLRADLQALGFEVDALSYQTQSAGAPGAPLQATVEHLITPGSVSRWV